MSARDPLAATELIGVIDLGSNSLRLVVFERLGSALLPLFNEKVMCGLGRGLGSTGRLNSDAIDLALVNLRRFVAFARAIGVDIDQLLKSRHPYKSWLKQGVRYLESDLVGENVTLTGGIFSFVTPFYGSTGRIRRSSASPTGSGCARRRRRNIRRRGR